MNPQVGVLALQGDFAEHRHALGRLGMASRRVRDASDLVGLDAIVLPGGESTTMLRLLEATALKGPLSELLDSGIPVLATCAGLILLARRVTEPSQASFGTLDIEVARNGYGRQVHSGQFALTGPEVPSDARGVFIRAPRILSVGPAARALAWRGTDPVLVQQGRILGCVFHPELEENHFVTRRFVDMITAS